MDNEECSKLTETDELGALVQYPDDGTDATDHLRPSALQQKTTKRQAAPWSLAGKYGPHNGMKQAFKKEKLVVFSFLPFTAGQLAVRIQKQGTTIG